MSVTNKGNYYFCIGCKFKIIKPFDVSSEKYPCYYSHNVIRGDVKYEKQFTQCLKRENI